MLYDMFKLELTASAHDTVLASISSCLGKPGLLQVLVTSHDTLLAFNSPP